MKKGFTLIEMLSVVVILGIIFLFVTPKLASMIKNGDDKNKELIEEKIISAAKEYVNDYDTDFLIDLTIVNDEKNISKLDLVESGLITEEELTDIDNFSVNVKLLNNDKLEYTIVYN